ncbi:MAG: hypothetical protein VX741_14685 [Pseudomonadota bacterium]|nr:hypothetical protein [Pseudomonadota bacterium]
MVGVAKILTGEMAAGEKRITDTADTCRQLGIANVVATCGFVLGDVYTRIAAGDEKPPLRVILKNLGYMLRTVPVAHAKAVRHLTAALEYYRTISAPSFIASTLFNLGLLDKKKKRMDAANAKFDEARELAASVDFQPLVEMIDEAKRVD